VDELLHVSLDYGALVDLAADGVDAFDSTSVGDGVQGKHEIRCSLRSN